MGKYCSSSLSLLYFLKHTLVTSCNLFLQFRSYQAVFFLEAIDDSSQIMVSSNRVVLSTVPWLNSNICGVDSCAKISDERSNKKFFFLLDKMKLALAQFSMLNLRTDWLLELLRSLCANIRGFVMLILKLGIILSNIWKLTKF